MPYYKHKTQLLNFKIANFNTGEGFPQNLYSNLRGEIGVFFERLQFRYPTKPHTPHGMSADGRQIMRCACIHHTMIYNKSIESLVKWD